MTERRLKRGLALLLTLCLAIPLSIALADQEDALEMAAYWRIVGNQAADDPLTQAMNGEKVPLDVLRTITPDVLLAFAAENKLPVSMARHAWYTAMADSLTTELSRFGSDTQELLSLFLAMKERPRDAAANQERRTVRRTMTETSIHAYAAETGLPEGFLVWLLLDDEWYESDWEDGDDWREGRRDWQIADWVDASDVQERYGKEAVVTEDDVERVLRQNGYRLDD